jgi:hypothetical protein
MDVGIGQGAGIVQTGVPKKKFRIKNKDLGMGKEKIFKKKRGWGMRGVMSLCASFVGESKICARSGRSSKT